MDYLSLFTKAALVENLALSFFLGMCMFLGVSRRIETAVGLGLAVFIVQSITVPLNNLIYTHLLKAGALAWAGVPEVDLGFLIWAIRSWKTEQVERSEFAIMTGGEREAGR